MEVSASLPCCYYYCIFVFSLSHCDYQKTAACLCSRWKLACCGIDVVAMCCHGNSGTPRQQQQQALDFGDEKEELLRDHEQSLRQLEVCTVTACQFSSSMCIGMKVSNRCSIIALVSLYPSCYPWRNCYFGRKCRVVVIWFCADWQSVVMPVSSLWQRNSTLNLMSLFALVLRVWRTAFGFIFRIKLMMMVNWHAHGVKVD